MEGVRERWKKQKDSKNKNGYDGQLPACYYNNECDKPICMERVCLLTHSF